MGIFSRRNLYRMLSENARIVRHRQLADHIKRLNGSDQIQRVTTEWEVVAVNGLSKVGNVVHEPDLPGPTKPDVLLTHSLGTALMDITTVSDRGLNQQNPADKLSDRLVQLVRERGLDPQRFGLKIEGNWRELRVEGPKPKIFIPRPREFDTSIFNKKFYRFLDEIHVSPRLKRKLSPSDLNAQMTITYDPTQRYFLMNHLAYTVPFSATRNAIYATLEEKADQLKVSEFNGLKGVVLCDGGCDAMNRRGRKGLDLDANDIILKFLADYRSVAFVLVLQIESDRSGCSGPDHLGVIAKGYLLSPDSPCARLVKYLSATLPQRLPKPENIPVNAYDLAK
jgi:hypothetical protein